MRNGTIERKTKETAIGGKLNLDGTGQTAIDIPVGFLAHMLDSFARHGRFDLELTGTGDLQVDQHHFVEDCGYVLGRLFDEALGDRSGIRRSGWFVQPMDDALSAFGVDIGGRPWLIFEGELKRRFAGDLDCDLLSEFFAGFSRGLQANVVVQLQRGENDHHRIEAAFKAFGRAMEDACARTGVAGVPSAKGSLDRPPEVKP